MVSNAKHIASNLLIFFRHCFERIKTFMKNSGRLGFLAESGPGAKELREFSRFACQTGHCGSRVQNDPKMNEIYTTG